MSDDDKAKAFNENIVLEANSFWQKIPLFHSTINAKALLTNVVLLLNVGFNRWNPLATAATTTDN